MSELRQLLDDFIKAKKRRYVSAKQIAATKRECEKVLDWLGVKKVAKVDKEDVELFLDHLADAGRSARTMNKYLVSIKGMFRWAELNDRIEKSPIRGVPPRNGPKVRVRQVFTEAQMRAIAAASKNGPSWQPLAVALGYYAAFRLREVMNLQWGRVLFDRGLLELRAEDQKGKKHSFVPMAETLKQMLVDAYELAEDTSPEALVLHMPKNPSIHHKEMLKRAGIPYIDRMGRVGDFHAFRHTCLNMMGEAGMPLAWIQDFARHAKPDTTRVYVRVNEEGMRKAASVLPEL